MITRVPHLEQARGNCDELRCDRSGGIHYCRGVDRSHISSRALHEPDGQQGHGRERPGQRTRSRHVPQLSPILDDGCEGCDGPEGADLAVGDEERGSELDPLDGGGDAVPRLMGHLHSQQPREHRQGRLDVGGGVPVL